MSIIAKYGGKCTRCGNYIPAGSQVMYDPGQGIRHKQGQCRKPGEAEPAPPSAPKPEEKVTDETRIRGRARYKGKSGYLILWMGYTKSGKHSAKLAFRDGSKTFWVDYSEIEIEKTYQDREWHGRTEPGMTFGRLNRLAEEYGRAKKDGIEACFKCGGIHRESGCYMCGCTRCDGARGGLCEDD